VVLQPLEEQVLAKPGNCYQMLYMYKYAYGPGNRLKAIDLFTQENADILISLFLKHKTGKLLSNVVYVKNVKICIWARKSSKAN
jgi:hypothetical protein